MSALNRNGAIFTRGEKRWMQAAEIQQPHGQIKFQAPIFPGLHEISEPGIFQVNTAGLEVLESQLATAKIHRPAIIGIREREIPHLAALVKIGNAGSSHFENCLRPGVASAQKSD